MQEPAGEPSPLPATPCNVFPCAPFPWHHRFLALRWESPNQHHQTHTGAAFLWFSEQLSGKHDQVSTTLHLGAIARRKGKANGQGADSVGQHKLPGTTQIKASEPHVSFLHLGNLFKARAEAFQGLTISPGMDGFSQKCQNMYFWHKGFPPPA